MADLFAELAKEIENGRDLRERISEQTKEMERISRALQSQTEMLHSTPWKDASVLLRSCNTYFSQARAVIQKIDGEIADEGYWKYSEMWSFSLQRFTACAALLCFAETGSLFAKDEVAALLVDDAAANTFMLTTEDYLHGLITAINELSRLSVNAVTMGDFEAPTHIAAFLKRLQSGFQLLNLKNDSLRRRFDSIKYDVKKTEEVVYDLTLRGLTKSSQEGTNGSEGLGQVRPAEQRKAYIASLSA